MLNIVMFWRLVVPLWGNVRDGKLECSLMIKAFIFGKFLPFHKGHEAMINFALTKCDFLTVLICCSDREKIPAATRYDWIKTTFESAKNLEIISYNYLESELPILPNRRKRFQKFGRISSRRFFPIMVW